MMFYCYAVARCHCEPLVIWFIFGTTTDLWGIPMSNATWPQVRCTNSERHLWDPMGTFHLKQKCSECALKPQEHHQTSRDPGVFTCVFGCAVCVLLSASLSFPLAAKLTQPLGGLCEPDRGVAESDFWRETNKMKKHIRFKLRRYLRISTMSFEDDVI